MKKSLFIIIIIPLLLAGCSDDKSTKAVTYLGSWKGCIKLNDTDGTCPGYGASAQEKILTFESRGALFTDSIYINIPSNPNQNIYVLTYTGTYKFAGSITAQDGNGSEIKVNKINYSIDSITITPANQDAANSMNLNSGMFGFTDWADGVAKNVAGVESFPNIGDIIYDLLYVEQNNDTQRLYIGKLTESLDRTTDEKRPIELDIYTFLPYTNTTE